MSGRVERALVDLVGGPEGGVTLWEIACGKLERIAREAREDGEYRFRSYPPGRLERLKVDVADAMNVAEIAAEVQAVIDADPLEPGERAADVAGLLLRRARELGASRQGCGVRGSSAG